MNIKIRLFFDWIIYLILITLLSIIFSIGAAYMSDIFENGMRILMKSDVIFGLVFSIIVTPVFLFGFSWGRFIDDRTRNKPIFLKVETDNMHKIKNS